MQHEKLTSPASVRTRPPYPPGKSTRGMRPSGSRVCEKRALKPSRSEARGSRRGVSGPRSHDPFAAITVRAWSSCAPASLETLATNPSPSRRSDSSVAGCSTNAPARAAAARRAESRMSRPIARPHASSAGGAGIGASTETSRANNPTRRTSDPARCARSPAMPSSSRIGHVVAEMYSPHTLRRGNTAFSTTITRRPWRASRAAAVAPDGPPPITSASQLMARSARRRRGG